MLPLPLGGAYDYLVPANMELNAGDFVRIPLGSRQLNGVVWGKALGDVDHRKLRAIGERHDLPSLSPDIRKFIDWVAGYTLAPPGAVLRMTMNVASVFKNTTPRVAYRLSGPLPRRMTKARERVVSLMQDGPPRSLADICDIAGVGSSVVRGLENTTALERYFLPEDIGFQEPDAAREGVELNAGQLEAVTVLNERLDNGGFDVTVIDGVPGAGKTEVYLEGIARTLQQGQQALILLPEIALTARWLERFETRFGVLPAQWHSELSQSIRRRTWRAVASGNARVVVGARSALFLPFKELGYIVIDEEHDLSFKQEEGTIYNARDMAVARGHLSEIPVTLVSATPSLETILNVDTGRYRCIKLLNRHGRAAPPKINAIDMRGINLHSGTWLSPELISSMRLNLESKEQTMLFLNRRGYAPLTLCRNCGFRFECPHCSAWLVEHRRLGRLICHHCGLAQRFPENCPECDAVNQFAACGPGVERLADEVVTQFPDARVEVVASDTVSGPRATRELIGRIENHDIDIIIGTQILAKGHHFPMLTLVGVVDADLGLDGGDLRAAERTYQLLYQVAGRAGRADRPGRVFLQTYLPDHPVMAAVVSGDSEAFLAREKEARKDAGMPPFGRLAAVIVSGQDERAVSETAQRLGRVAPNGEAVSVFGPAPAPLSILRGRYRYRLLLKTTRQVFVQELIRQWIARIKCPSSVRIQVDIDPYSFL